MRDETEVEFVGHGKHDDLNYLTWHMMMIRTTTTYEDRIDKDESTWAVNDKKVGFIVPLLSPFSFPLQQKLLPGTLVGGKLPT